MCSPRRDAGPVCIPPCAGNFCSRRVHLGDRPESLASDHVADLCRISGKAIRCGVNRLNLHALSAHARDPGDYSGVSPDHRLRTGELIANLQQEFEEACAHREDPCVGVVRQ
jgi:hypothetical protein